MQEMQEAWVQFPGGGNSNPLQYSSILAWKIPCTEEHGGLLSVESQRVGHDWVTELKSLTSVVCYFFLIFIFFPFFSFFFFKILFYFLTLQYCIGFAVYQNESATGTHVFLILNPPPSSFLIPSLWVVPVHQPQASSIVHRTWTGDSFHIRYYTYFNAILPNHLTLSLSHRVQKTVLYISVSFAVSYTGLLLPSF